MTTEYKNHTILATVTKEGERWHGRVAVEWSEGGDAPRVQPFTITETFSSEGEAESWLVAFAKKWIDDGKPNLQQP
jgi:hypothetical protein